MKIGITGHQKRQGINWNWVAQSISAEIARLGPFNQAFSSLAAGSDQVFAQCAYSAGIPIISVIPTSNYEKFFDGENLDLYKDLLRRSTPVFLEEKNSPEESFLAAGKYIVDKTDLLIAVWDEKPAAGVGGTADIVNFARSSGKNIIVINPIEEMITR